jgi:TetR/AcrR family tetracycline transcriptional repressor
MPPAHPPRRRTLTRERVVDSALALVEREGLPALTMRRLGSELGVEGMALYTHVRNKADLLDAVAERVLEGLAVPLGGSAPWQERIRACLLAWAALQERHPRAFPLVSRPGLRTEAVRALTEEILDALRTAGFDERGAALAYETIVVLVDSALVSRSSWTDADLQRAWRAGHWRANRRRYPRSAEVAAQAARLTWREILDSGVELLLGGLEARLRAARS